MLALQLQQKSNLSQASKNSSPIQAPRAQSGSPLIEATKNIAQQVKDNRFVFVSIAVRRDQFVLGRA